MSEEVWLRAAVAFQGTHTSTWKHPNTTATRLSTQIYMHVCVCVCLKGEFVCERECLHITQHFFFFFSFLISRIGPGFCLGRRRQRERWCSVLCCYCLSHTDAHTHTRLNTHTHTDVCFSKVSAEQTVLLLMWLPASFKWNCPQTWYPDTFTHKNKYVLVYLWGPWFTNTLPKLLTLKLISSAAWP